MIRTLKIVFIYFVAIQGAFAMDISQITETNVNGIPVIVRTTPTHGEIVSLVLTARGGVTLTPQAGALELLTSSLPKGTPSYTKEAIDRLLIETGAIFGIDAKSDSVEVSLTCLKKFIPSLMPIISEMLIQPSLLPDEIELVRRQHLAALKSEQEEPDGIIALMNHQAFFKNHPYLNRPSGYLTTFETITRDDLVALLPRVFNRQNVFAVMVGNISSSEAESWMNTYFSMLPTGVEAAKLNTAIQNETGQIGFQKNDAPTTYFMARFSSPRLPDDDYPAMAIGSEILGHRLFEEVRTKRGLTYSVSAGIGTSLANSGVLYVSSTQLAQAVKVMFDEVKKLQTELIPQKEFENQIKKFLSNWHLSRESSSSQTKILSYYLIQGMSWKDSNSFIDRLKKSTPESVRAAAQKYFRNYTVSVVGPAPVPLNGLIPGY